MFYRLLILLSFLFLYACGSEPDIVFEQPANAKPAIWEVKGETGSAYLFGTMHVLPENIIWRTDVLDEAIARSDWLLLELSPVDTPETISETFSIMATTPGQGVISERISPAMRKIAADVLIATDVSEGTFQNIESWGAALMISSSSARGMGTKSDYGAEKILTREFEKRGKSIAGLESAAQQFSYFDTLSQNDQRAMLEAVIASADEAAPNYRRLLNSWLSGDMDALRDASNSGFLSRESIRRAIITDRNEAWAQQIALMLENYDATGFIAVGAGHLAGDDSVQSMLEKRGYKITRVQ